MLQRELSRVGLCTLAGALLGPCFAWGSGPGPILLSIPTGALYAIGLVYANQLVLRMIQWVLKNWFSFQMTSIIFKSLSGTIACCLLLILGLSFSLSVGWVIGLGKAVQSLIQAAQTDQSFSSGFSQEFPGGEDPFDPDHWDF